MAQPPTGVIRGRVVDPAGAVVSSANVKILSVASLEREGTTDGDGNFSISRLEPGTYSVRVSAPDLRYSSELESRSHPAEPLNWILLSR